MKAHVSGTGAMAFPAQDGEELLARSVRDWAERISSAHHKVAEAERLRGEAKYHGTVENATVRSRAAYAASDHYSTVHRAVFQEIEQALLEAGVKAIHDKGAAA